MVSLANFITHLVSIEHGISATGETERTTGKDRCYDKDY